MTAGILHEDLAFAYRLVSPQETDEGGALFLLHGSATDEATLIPLARRIAPRSLLLAVRGRVMQDGERRWFRKVTPVSFDQDSIRVEAAAFADFVEQAAARHGFDPRRAVFMGYSNGANLVSSVMLRHPGLISRAVLLRAMPVLDTPPAVDLSAAAVLVVAGERDETYGPYAPALVRLLRGRGARVSAFTALAGHEIGEEDIRFARDWLAGPPQVTPKADPRLEA